MLRRLILAAAATLAIFFGFAGTAYAQTGSGPGSGDESTTSSTTATTVFVGGGEADRNLASTGADTWFLVTGAGVATAGAIAARRLLRNQAS